MPVVVVEPAVLDWQDIYAGRLEEVTINVTNHGFIAAKNLIVLWPYYWENFRFLILDEEMKPNHARILGDLPAKSSTTFTVKIEKIVRFIVPEDRVEMRFGTNDCVFVPHASDTAWELGPDVVIAPGDDPVSGQMYVKLSSNATIEYLYEYATHDLYEIIYEYNATEDDFDVVNVVVTHNASFPGSSRRLSRAVQPQRGVVAPVNPAQNRNLLTVENVNLFDCTQDSLCVSCKLLKLYLELNGGKIAKVAIAKVTQRMLRYSKTILERPLVKKAFGKVAEWTKILEALCGEYDEAVKWSKISKAFCQDSANMEALGLDGICDFDPCDLICKDPTKITGFWHYVCGDLNLCGSYSFEIPTFGRCFELVPSQPSTPGPPVPPPVREPWRVVEGGGEDAPPCGRCGWFTERSHELRVGSACTPSLEISIITEPPEHVVPSHRAMLRGCPTCSKDLLRETVHALDGMDPVLLSVEAALQRCASAALSDSGLRALFPCILGQSLTILRVMPVLANVLSCQLLQEPCYKSAELASSPGLVNLLLQARRIQSLVELVLLPFGGILSGETLGSLNSSAIVDQTRTAFRSTLANVTADNSQSGKAIALDELTSLIAILPTPIGHDIERFALSWNESLVLWDQGVIDLDSVKQNQPVGFFDLARAETLSKHFLDARDSLRQEGFSGFADAWLSAVEGQQFEEARKLAGICATVRVVIEQELTMTRTGFEARLEVSNNGGFMLENVSVALRATPFGNASFDATKFFAFGEPTLSHVSAVNGSGVINPTALGRATWLIIPLAEAAPMFSTKYDLGGILLYSIQGVVYQQSLAPSTITVMPDPQLHLTYFLSREVFSDDPFTDSIVEPPVPFHLGLLIYNRGYGEARNVEMSSSQPKIVENEKGLLVDFTIIGTRLGNETATMSLTIDFGNIEARSKKFGIWEMVSSLRGEFSNFSAFFIIWARSMTRDSRLLMNLLMYTS
jgi:hypothetical protein